MKNILLFVAVITLLISCNKDLDLDIKYQLETKIDMLDVVKDLKDYDNTDLFPNGTIDIDEYKVRVSGFLYNSSGELVSEETELVDDFSKSVTITSNVEKGEYTLVFVADIVENSNDNVSFEYWKMENKNVLRDFKITDTGFKGYEYKALGVSKSVINIEKSESVSIKMEPIGSLITFWFYNIDYTKVAFLEYGWEKNSDYYRVNEDKPNIKTDLWTDEYETESEYTGYYDQRYFLPIQQFSFMWESYSPDLNIILSKVITFNIQSGINKQFEIDVNSGQYDETNSTKSAIISSSFNTLRIQSLPTKRIITKE